MILEKPLLFWVGGKCVVKHNVFVDSLDDNYEILSMPCIDTRYGMDDQKYGRFEVALSSTIRMRWVAYQKTEMSPEFLLAALLLEAS